MEIEKKAAAILAAQGRTKADLVIKNAQVLNVFTERFATLDVAVCGEEIVGVGAYEGIEEIDGTGKYLVPAFIDGHVHLESSIISPLQYAKAVVPHGTTAVVTDPHEITNVSGKAGFAYMQEAAKGLPIDVYFTVPSCVPATPFDETGATVTHEEVEKWLQNPNVLGLAEMMNYPGVLSADKEVLQKLAAAERAGKRIDGHAPTLQGNALNAYVAAGVSSDHECTNAAEAIEKIEKGQWIMVREGTASKNLHALLPLFEKPYCDRCMLVTDDKHPGELIREGHIDCIVRKAIAQGANAINAYKMASYNAANYFRLHKNGAIAPGYFADFLLLDDWNAVAIAAVYKRGKRVDNALDGLENGRAENPHAAAVGNSVRMPQVCAENFRLKRAQERVIGLVQGQILTTDEGYACKIDVEKDICKLAVIERHKGTGHIGVAFVKGYGLRTGAVATSVAHDSHNVIVVGANEEDMACAANAIAQMQGGMVVVNEGKILASLALPIAGLMCDLEANECQAALSKVKEAAHALGVNRGIDPFMTLSFSSLAVIPQLRLTTLGVVDVNRFQLL